MRGVRRFLCSRNIQMSQNDYSYPDPATLEKYLALLTAVLKEARFRAYESDLGVTQLLDAVHNVPDLLTRWHEAEPEWIRSDLYDYEQRHGLTGRPFTSILDIGPPANWRLRWGPVGRRATGKVKEAMLKRQVFAIVRIDQYGDDPISQDCISVVRVVDRREEAEAEVIILGKVNEGKGCTYHWQATRLRAREGR